MKLNQFILIHMRLHNVINICCINYRSVPLIQTTSTAAAAKYVSENPDEKIAAIGNRLAAKKYDLHMAEENIHDFHFNHTRFVVLSYEKVN